MNTIKYAKGRIDSSNDLFKTELDSILKLNIDYLKERRRKI